jgi:hypothetical protein
VRRFSSIDAPYGDLWEHSIAIPPRLSMGMLGSTRYDSCSARSGGKHRRAYQNRCTRYADR